MLKKAGYDTALIGKWDLAGKEGTGIPGQHGFDYSFGYQHSSLAHNYYPDFLWRNGQKLMLEGNKNGQGTQYAHDLFTSEALLYIKKYIEQDKKNPFFLYLAYTIPHAELAVPADSLKPYLGKFKEKAYRGPKSKQWQPGRYQAQQTPKAVFAAMISRLDRDIGQLLAKLKVSDLDKETIVFFVSDNGPHREGGIHPNDFQSAGPLRGMKRGLI